MMFAVHARRRIVAATLLAGCLALLPSGAAMAQTLRGSQASLDRQNLQAHRHGFLYADTAQDVYRMVERGSLVLVEANSDFSLKEVSFPYARPEVKHFVERLALRYKEACDEELVVTSLTRPRRMQPPNASWRSVHPTGMALDLRRSWSRRCRSWLEGVLVSLEGEGILEAAIERIPPHYHVALFPEPYRDLLAELEPGGDEFRVTRYQVHRGDTLASIAARHRTTVEQVKQSNGLRSDMIYPGQLLVLPIGR
jgi:Family of unknown function (DUF5715)/LysM domain